MAVAKRTKEIISLLNEKYSTEYKCYLDYEEPWQLLIATILSAQCTDACVNMVTPALFQKYDSPQKLAGADLAELETYIHSTGFYHNKAKNVIACAKQLVELYDGVVPKETEELTKLSGVGRKTANVIRGNIYHIPSIVVDTHVKRISTRLGLCTSADPVKIEFELMKKLPKEQWILYNIQVIAFGREICYARHPKCKDCFMKPYCREEQKND